MSKNQKQGGFTSSLGFIMAAVGSAVGMGNIWLFPYRMTQCGGGAFLIPYFLFIALFSYAGLSAEFALGRLTGTGTAGSFEYIFQKRGWKGGALVGLIPVLGVLGIAIGYSVVVGWGLRYAAGAFSGSILSGDTQAYFDAMATDFGSIPWHLIAVVLTAVILILGVSGGIETISKFMMPAFFVLFIIIAVRVSFLPGAEAGYRYLLTPDWSQLAKPMTWIYAMGQAFFSLSINGAGMLIYGSYMKKDENIIYHAGITALLDTCAALLAAFAILPAVFAFDIPLNRGPSLMFVTLPRVFQLMPAGRLFAILFFVSVFFAGITSLINMMEASGEALSSRTRLSRPLSVVVIAAVVFGTSVFLETVPKMGTWLDVVTIYIAPFAAVLCAVLIYFVLGMKDIKAELDLGRKRPLGRQFDVIAYVYVILAAAVVVFGIAYGGIG